MFVLQLPLSKRALAEKKRLLVLCELTEKGTKFYIGRTVYFHVLPRALDNGFGCSCQDVLAIDLRVTAIHF